LQISLFLKAPFGKTKGGNAHVPDSAAKPLFSAND